MSHGRALLLALVLLLVSTFSSSVNTVIAKGRPLAAFDACHDDIWGVTEYCGRDAYVTTGVPDMNHDCLVNGLDVGLFMDMWRATGPGMSADLNDDNIVDEKDVQIFAPSIGSSPSSSDCLGQTPSTCQGTIALSFSSNPATIDDNETQAPGTHTVYVVIDGFTGAKFVEYAITAGPNVLITGNTLLVPGNNGQPACNWGTFNDVIAFASPLPSGPVVVAQIQYELLNSSPATMVIRPGDCPWARVRWAKESANISYDFANVLSVGINGATPSPSPCSAGGSVQIGAVSGTVYDDVDADCVYDSGSDLPSDHLIQLAPGPYFGSPDPSGNYTVQAPVGQYTVSLYATPGDHNEIQACQNSTYTVNVTANGLITGLNFPLKPHGVISGRVFRDLGGSSCVFESNVDLPLAGRIIEVNPGGYLGLTDYQGNYSMVVPVGQYTVTQDAIPGDPYALQPCQVPSYSVTADDDGVYDGRDFSMVSIAPPYCGVDLSIVHNGINFGPAPCTRRVLRTPCPGIETEYIFVLKVKKVATDPMPGGSTLDITLGSDFVIGGVTANWPITVVSSNSAYERSVRFDAPVPPGAVIAVKVRATSMSGGPYNAQGELDSGACDEGIHTAISVLASQCSCDPNDLAVLPEGCGPNHEVVGDESFVYTIRFENVGPGPAHDISIDDQLDPDLDLSTLHVIASSHGVTGVQLNPGNKALVRMDGIELPGTFGLQNNKGYVILGVDPLPGLADGTVIQSQAAITFDFNDPVITNVISNTIKANPCPVTDVDGPKPLSNYLGAVHPNPFNPATSIDFGLAVTQRVTIAIYNVRGELVRTLLSEDRPAGQYSVVWDGRNESGDIVASGVYLSRMTAGSFSDVKKMVMLK
jgi:hypothetical protein